MAYRVVKRLNDRVKTGASGSSYFLFDKVDADAVDTHVTIELMIKTNSGKQNYNVTDEKSWDKKWNF